MGQYWRDQRVYYRDFAYNARRLRMATGTIGDLPSASFASLLSGSMIDIYVGKSRKKWTVHKNLLYHHSELLESELKGKDSLELQDYSVEGFELLIKWLYQGKLDDVSDFSDATQKYEYATSCHKLYLLCERLDLPTLKNVAMDQFRKGLHDSELVPDPDEMLAIYRPSPANSPFRRLMVKIAARQIMDNSDVEGYRECLEEPDFAIDLVKAIKEGTGSILFEDPTAETGNTCEWHDHQDGPNCHIKGKGKVKQALKAPPARHRDPKYGNFDRSKPSGPLHRPPRPSPLPAPPPNRRTEVEDPQPLPRPVRQPGGGHLPRRLTSPASSTIEMSTENVMGAAAPPSPKDQRDKFRKVTPPEKRRDDRPPSSDGSRQLQGSESSEQSGTSDKSDKGDSIADVKANTASLTTEDTSPRRGIWEWARLGYGRRPPIEWKFPNPVTSKAPTSAPNGMLEGTTGSLDDFSLLSSTVTDPENIEQQNDVAAAKLEGFGISNSTADPAMFSQTKDSSDELLNLTPSPNTMRTGEPAIGNGTELSPPATPSPQPRKKSNITEHAANTPSPRRVPTYKIALAQNILSPRTFSS